jgi:uncharacterized membrane protein
MVQHGCVGWIHLPIHFLCSHTTNKWREVAAVAQNSIIYQEFTGNVLGKVKPVCSSNLKTAGAVGLIVACNGSKEVRSSSRMQDMWFDDT